MRLLFAARALHDMAGGVERMIIAVMNEMVRRGHEVALFSWDKADAKTFYELDAAIEWYKLDIGDPAKKAGLKSRLSRAPAVRKVVSDFKPDAIVCFQGGPFRALKVYTLGLGVPMVAAERNAPTQFDHVQKKNGREVEHFFFRFAKRITVQFDRYRSMYPKSLHHLIVETPNPVDEAQNHAVPDKSNYFGRYTLLSVGRLSYQKNYPVLISAFARIASRFPDWDVKIVGEGEDRKKIEDFIARFPALQGRISLPGTTKNVSKEYAAAHLFCLPSRWEGFPNALAEALAHGLPSTGFAECAGVYDLIDDNESGLLVNGLGDEEALAGVLASLMENPSLRAQMGAAATHAMRQYRPELCFDKWEKVLIEAAGRND